MRRAGVQSDTLLYFAQPDSSVHFPAVPQIARGPRLRPSSWRARRRRARAGVLSVSCSALVGQSLATAERRCQGWQVSPARAPLRVQHRRMPVYIVLVGGSCDMRSFFVALPHVIGESCCKSDPMGKLRRTLACLDAPAVSQAFYRRGPVPQALYQPGFSSQLLCPAGA